MENHDEVKDAVSAILADILNVYHERVPDNGAFKDIRLGRQVQFDDPTTALPGRLELVVMNMDPRLDPKYDRLRFLSVRVMKSRAGGYSSSTCLHGSKSELYTQLEELAEDPEFLVMRVLELAEGLPEESNPDVWR